MPPANSTVTPASLMTGKDFQKQKHRVGKAKPGAVNATDTSFKAKKLLLREQNVDKKVDWRMLISQASHHKPMARKEALSRLERLLPVEESHLRSFAECAARSMVDEDASVRQIGLSFNRRLFAEHPNLNLDLWLGYWKLAMTHLNGTIRSDALKTIHSLNVASWPIMTLLSILVEQKPPNPQMHREVCLALLRSLEQRDHAPKPFEVTWNPHRQRPVTISKRRVSKTTQITEELYVKLVTSLFEGLGDLWLEAAEAMATGSEIAEPVSEMIRLLSRFDPANLFVKSVPRHQIAQLGNVEHLFT